MIRALAAALAAALLALLVQTGRLHLLQREVARADQLRAEANAEAERLARRAQTAIDDRTRKATDAYITRQVAARGRADSFDGAYRGLLNAIAAAGGTADDPAAACRADAERAARYQRLLAEAAGLAVEGGKRVEDLAAKVAGLQDHARAVSGPASGAAGPAAEVPLTP